MADTTIKVSMQVRDRLALLASERGMTMRDLVEQLATSMPAADELIQRQEAAASYVRAHLRPSLTAHDIEQGEQLWQHLESTQPIPASSSGESGDGEGAAA